MSLLHIDHEDKDEDECTDYNGIGAVSNKDDPRYAHLQMKQCEHKITVMRGSAKGAGQTVLDWISENVSAPWSVHHYVDKSIFSFSDLQDATLFRLRF